MAIALLLLFVVTIAVLFAVDTYNERALIEKVENTMEAVTKAIEVASEQAQLSTTGAIDTEILQDYAEKLRLRGVREIQILNPERTVIASSKTRNETKARAKKKAPGNISITGTLGSSPETTGPLREYRLIMPIISQNQKVGYVTVDLLLDDYEGVLTQNFRRRLAAVTAVFSVGLLLLLVLTHNFTRPIGELSAAAERVAGGDLNAEIATTRKDDLGSLVHTWNAMLARMREQRELESRLALAERRVSLGHLATGIAHEIRNPLNTIALAVDYLRRRFRPAARDDAEEFEKTTESLREEIARLNSLITSFLTYGKPLQLAPSTWDAAELVRTVARELQPDAATRGIALRVSGDEHAEFTGDRNLMKSAFLNVALNALQMMPSGGALDISVASDGGEVRVVFDDTGPGIAPELLPRIFEPYFSTRDAGVGLGLAMTRKIVSDHGGDLRASNRAGGGSRFEFVLPRAPFPVAVPA